jgi:Domain of unknown function (DUF4177)
MRQRLILILAALLIIGTISWRGYSQRANMSRTSWEYLMVGYVNTDETQRKLNELGAQGWEVVAVSDKVLDQGNQTSTHFVLKRARY